MRSLIFASQMRSPVSLLRSFMGGSGVLLALLTSLLGVQVQQARAVGPTCTVDAAGGADYTTITAAVDDPNCGAINVAAGTYNENIRINRNVSVIGIGSVVVDGNSRDRVFYVGSGDVLLKNLTIQNGAFTSGFDYGNFGGGIMNFGTLTLDSVLVRRNSVTGFRRPGRLNITAGYGGGIYNDGQLTIRNSTIAENHAVGQNLLGWLGESLGSGIYNNNQLTITFSTIANNRWIAGTESVSEIYNSWNKGITWLSNSIINEPTGIPFAGSPITVANRTCAGTVINLGNNIDNDGSCTGTALDPKLTSLGLQNNGGSSETIALQPDSPAIDAANSADCPITDQRGVTRPQGAACDIGAFEYAAANPIPSTPTPTTIPPTLPPTSTPTQTPLPSTDTCVSLDRTGWGTNAFLKTDMNLAIDGDKTTSWKTNTAQARTQWFSLNLRSPRQISGITLDAMGDPANYARTFKVQVSNDGANWTTVASVNLAQGPVTRVRFPTVTAIYVAVILDATNFNANWSISDFDVCNSTVAAPPTATPAPPSACAPMSRASWVGYSSEPGDVALAIDNSISSFWTNGGPQIASHWYGLSFAPRKVSGITLNTVADPANYPRQFIVSTSTDGGNWTRVATVAGQGPVIPVRFDPINARYLAVELAATAWDANWSIADLEVCDGGSTSVLLTGARNVINYTSQLSPKAITIFLPLVTR